MTIGEITGYLDSIAPPALQESYDNAGLLVGNSAAEATGALLALDVTEAVVQDAMDKGVNLVVAHHPIIFGGLKRLTGTTYVERTVQLAIKNDVAIYAAHTNLDNVHRGVNARICEKLGLQDTQILVPKKGLLKKLFTFAPHDQAGAIRDALFASGAGHIGEYDACSFNTPGTGTFRGSEATSPYVGQRGQLHEEPETKIEVIFPAWLEWQVVKALKENHPYEEVAYDVVSLDNAYGRVGSGMIGTLAEAMDEMSFLKHLKKSMQTDCVRYTSLRNKPVQKVAVCGGAGSFLLPNAIRTGADVFVTGDFKYHQFFDADGKVVIADIGHYESEQFTMHLMHDLLQEKFTNFALHFTEVNTNPIKYLT